MTISQIQFVAAPIGTSRAVAAATAAEASATAAAAAAATAADDVRAEVAADADAAAASATDAAASAASASSQVTLVRETLPVLKALPGDHLSGDAITFLDSNNRRLASFDVTGAMRDNRQQVDLNREASGALDNEYAAGIVDSRGALLLGVREQGGMVEVFGAHGEPNGVAYLDAGAVRASLMNGQTITLSVAGATHSRLVQTGNTITFWREGDEGFDYLVSESIQPIAPLASGITELIYTPMYGQSNSVDFGASPPITLTPDTPGRSLMFSGGPVMIPPVPAGVTTALYDPFRLRLWMMAGLRDMVSAPRAQNGGLGETPCPGLGWSMTQLLAGSVAHIGGTLGIGGAGIDSLVKTANTANSTGQAYRNLIASVRRAKVIADLLGLPIKVRAVGFIQGESNHNTTDAVYRPFVVALQASLDTDIRAITGQAETVLLACHQTFKKNSGTLNDAVNVVLDLALTQPDKFLCSGPSYPYQHPDGIHTDAAGKRQQGEQLGRAIARRLSGVTHPMLYMASAVRSGTTITLGVGGAEGSLVWDTTVTNPNTYRGFEFVQTGGNSVTITDVQISGTEVVLTLSATPTGTSPRVIVAGAGSVSATAPSSGPSTGPRCQLRDSATFLGADGGARYKYACHQVINVTT